VHLVDAIYSMFHCFPLMRCSTGSTGSLLSLVDETQQLGHACSNNTEWQCPGEPAFLWHPPCLSVLDAERPHGHNAGTRGYPYMATS
jgi:hypothetical protein